MMRLLKSVATAPQALLLLGSLLSGAGVVRADNPIVQTLYTADPAPNVWNNRLYVFTSHDEDDTSSGFFNMKDWRLYSTTDMANWQDHGSPMGLTTFSWASKDAWAGQVIARNNKFYYYVPIVRRGGSMSIGVGVSDNILGPYKDALGKPLLENGQIDPTVYIDDNGQAYLYWGNPDLWYVKLNADMISYSGSPTKVQVTGYQEGPWFYKRNNLYYMIYAGPCCSEDIRYSTASSPTGPWQYRGVIMPTQGKSFTNHPGMIDYKGNSYFFYHNGALPGGGGYTRSVAVERFVYGSDGSIPSMQMTTNGPPQVGTLDPYVRQEGETMAWSSGVETEVCSEGGMALSYLNNGDYVKLKGVGFGTAGAKSFSARVSSGTSGGKIELRLGSATGTLVGTCSVSGTGGWSTWTTVSCNVSGATGTQDLYLRFTGSGSDSLFNINWWQFTANGSTEPVTSATSATSASVPPQSTTSSAPPTTTSQPGTNCAALYGQCGGDNYNGPKCCAQGTCKFSNQWYSQCL